MNAVIVESSDPVTLVAGGPVRLAELRMALRRAPVIVAADGGADRALGLGVVPQAVIGDLDSVSARARESLVDVLHPITEQMTTDFDKALRSIRAPFVLALGATGGRMDHELAVLSVLVAHAARSNPMPCLLLTPEDVIFAVPPQIRLNLRAGDRLSLFPMMPVSGCSTGLRWPIDGIAFAPDGMIGTSNEVAEGPVQLRLDGPGMLAILPRGRLDAALTGLLGAVA